MEGDVTSNDQKWLIIHNTLYIYSFVLHCYMCFIKWTFFAKYDPERRLLVLEMEISWKMLKNDLDEKAEELKIVNIDWNSKLLITNLKKFLNLLLITILWSTYYCYWLLFFFHEYWIWDLGNLTNILVNLPYSGHTNTSFVNT